MRGETWIVVLTAIVAIAPACAGGGPEGTTAETDAEHAAAMAREHAGEEPVASPATEGDTEGVAGRRVTYATLDGTEVTGYLASAAEATAGRPGLVVIHEWYGLNDNIRSMADQLATLGYTALAVDLYEGTVAADAAAARQAMEKAMARPERVEENLRQAYRYLETEAGAPRIGAIGWCFGGGWSLQTALLFPRELDAAVVYYGRVVTDRETLAPLEVPILGLFGAEDQGIPVASVRAFEAALAELGKQAEIHVYEGAGHAFANPSGERYQADAAEAAWAETVDFLARHLADGGGAG